MALLHSTWLYNTLQWLYFTLLECTLLYHGSTSLYVTLHHSSIALLTLLESSAFYHSSSSLCLNLYITIPWLYFTVYLTLNYSTMALLHSTWLYTTLQFLYFTLLDFTSLFHGSTSLFLNLYIILYHGCTLLYLTLHYSIMALFNLTLLDSTTALYFTLLDSTLLYHGSILHSTWLNISLKSLYCTLLDPIRYSTMALLHSTLLYNTLPWIYTSL